jgi:hypothetical protein
MTLTTDAGLGMVFTASKIGYGMVQGRAMSNSYTAWGEAVLRGEVSYISKRVQDSEGLHSDASIANMYETLRMMRAELRTRN